MVLQVAGNQFPIYEALYTMVSNHLYNNKIFALYNLIHFKSIVNTYH